MTFLFGLAILTAPIRSSALILFIGTYEILYLIKNLDKKGLSSVVKHLGTFGTVTLVMVLTGVFGRTSQQSNNNLSSFFYYFKTVTTNISANNYTDIKSLLYGIGNIFSPSSLDIVLHFIRNYSWKIGAFYSLIAVTITLLFIFNKKFDKSLLNLSAFALWPIIFYLMSYIPIANRGQAYFTNDPRYMLLSFAGFCIFAILGYYLIKKRGFKLVAYIVLFTGVFYITAQSLSTYKYFESLANTRNGILSRAIWQQLKEHVPDLPRDKFTFFYFEHNYNSGLINDTLLVGFLPHAAVVYNLPNVTPTLNPLTADSFEILRSVVENGKAFEIHGRKTEPLPKDYIYAFRIEEQKLIDIKDEVFAKLK